MLYLFSIKYVVRKINDYVEDKEKFEKIENFFVTEGSLIIVKYFTLRGKI